MIKPKQIEPEIISGIEVTQQIPDWGVCQIDDGEAYLPDDPMSAGRIYCILEPAYNPQGADVRVAGHTKVKISASVNAGDLLIGNTSGYAEPIPYGTNTHRILGIALESGSANDIIQITMTNHYQTETSSGSTILKNTLDSSNTSWQQTVPAGEYEIMIDAADLNYNSDIVTRAELLINGKITNIVTPGKKEVFTKYVPSSIKTRIRGVHLDNITHKADLRTSSYTSVTDVCVRGNRLYITADGYVYEWIMSAPDSISTAGFSGIILPQYAGLIKSFYMSKNGHRCYALESTSTGGRLIIGYYLPNPFSLGLRNQFCVIDDRQFTMGDECIRLSDDLSKIYNSYNGRLHTACMCQPGDVQSIVGDFRWNGYAPIGRKFHIHKNLMMSCDHLYSGDRTHYFPLLEDWTAVPAGRADYITNSKDAVWFNSATENTDSYLYFADNAAGRINQYMFDDAAGPTVSGEVRIVIK